MNIERIILTLRRFGLKGVWNWFLSLLGSKDHLLRALQSHVKNGIVPTRGITLVGDISGHNSLSKVFRDFARSLKEANIPFQTVDISHELPSDLILNRYTGIVTMFVYHKLHSLCGCRQYRIMFWEFDTGFVQCYPDAIGGKPIIVFSDYCYQTIRQQTHSSVPVKSIRYPFHFDARDIIPAKDIRTKFGIPPSAFMVFFNFDYRSSYYRKNPEGLLQAFLQAFGRTENVMLVFKTIGSQKKKALSDKIKRLVAQQGAAAQVRFIDDYISDDEIVSLTAACDVYASLHRGEGFGLGIAEAMSMGKAVVVSDCGSTNEFCHSDTAEIVSHKIVDVKSEEIDQPLYSWVGTWPEPDVHEASVALRKLYDNPTLRNELGQRAKAFIKEYYSLDNFKESMKDFLEQRSP